MGNDKKSVEPDTRGHFVELAKLSHQSFEDRRRYEWRLSLSLWGALGLVGYVVVTNRSSVRFPYVPAGRHGIWFLRANHEIRVGEVEVRAGNEIRHELTLSGTAVLRGRPDPYGESAAELRRLDGQVVAREAWSSSDFAFIGLRPGSYVLVLGERRIPVQLAADQDLDLGILR